MKQVKYMLIVLLVTLLLPAIALAEQGMIRQVGIFDLYIPHGSDESNCVYLPLVSPPKLYIPHGSDESLYLNHA